MSGLLGKADLVINTPTVIYTATKTTTCNIRLANRTSGDALVRVAVGTGASPELTDYLSYDTPVGANGFYEDTAIVLSAGEKIFAQSNVTGVSVRVHGY